MTLDEGYIKYDSHWTRRPAAHATAAAVLERWRKPLHQAGLIGIYNDVDIGFGNLSLRMPIARQFLISGTQTGHIETTTAEHYSLVIDYDIAANRVSCVGPVQASSEAMTHAALYELDESIESVVHVHSRELWEASLGTLPTTGADVPYGTPEMAQEFGRLYRDSDFGRSGIAVMAGHEEGLVAIGASPGQAAERLLSLMCV